MKHRESRILSNQEIAPGVFELIADTKDFPKSIPGQFMMVYPNRNDLILPRPISICRQVNNLTMLVYKTVGKGTAHLSSLKPGDNVRIMGPLGNGFKINENKSRIALVGGGIGIPPMVSVFDRIRPDTDVDIGAKNSKEVEITVLLGFKDSHFLTTLFNGANLHIISEDTTAFKNPPFPTGTVFPKNGSVLDLLNELDSENNYDEIYACGPKPMLAALSRYAKERNIPLQVSLEERMACGVGACLGCAAMSAEENYVKICCDGPVFYSDKVVLD